MGSLAEWVSALAALGALFAAVWAAVTSRKLFNIESERDRYSAAREVKQQASGIASWCVKVFRDKEPKNSNGILVHNSTESPVYAVEIASTYSKSKDSEPVERALFYMDVLPPGDFVTEEDPTYHWTFPDQRGDIVGAVRPITKNKNWRVVSLKFTDSYGLRWIRDDNGLREITSTEQA